MSFKEIAEKPFVESCFGRYHWCKASDVQDRIKELEEAHEAELKELRESFKKEMDKQSNDRMKDSVRLFSAAQAVNSMASSLMNLVDVVVAPDIYSAEELAHIHTLEYGVQNG